MKILSEKHIMNVEVSFDEVEKVLEKFCLMDDYTVESEQKVEDNAIRVRLIKEVSE